MIEKVISKFSPSMISMYLQCPGKFKFHYIDGLSKKYYQEKPYTSLGGSIHKALDIFYRNPDLNLRTEEKLQGIFKKFWSRKGYMNVEEEREYFLRGVDILNRFSLAEDLKIIPVSTELYINFEFNSSIIHGKVDRIDRGENNLLTIIDYKTGRYLPAEEDVNNDLQLLTYCLGVEKQLKEPISKFELKYLEFNKTFTIEFNEEKKKYIQDILKDSLDKMKSDETFEYKDNIFCPFCDYSVICPLKNKEKTAEEKMNDTIEKLYSLDKASMHLTSSLEAEKLKEALINVLSETIPAMKIAIFLQNKKTEELQIFAGYNISQDTIKNLKFKKTQGLAGYCFSENKPLNLRNAFEDERFFGEKNPDEELPFLAIPIQYSDQVIGVICLEEKRIEHYFSELDLISLRTVSGHIANAINNARMYNKIKLQKGKIQQQFNQLNAIYKVSSLINKSDDLEEIISSYHQTLSALFSLNKFIFYLKDELTGNYKKIFYHPQTIGIKKNQVHPQSDIVSSLYQRKEIFQFEPIVTKEIIDSDTALLGIGYFIGENMPAFALLELNNEITNNVYTILNILSSQVSQAINASILKENILDVKSRPINYIINDIDSQIKRAKEEEIPFKIYKINILNFEKYLEKNGYLSAQFIADQIYIKLKDIFSGVLIYRIKPNSFIVPYFSVQLEEILAGLEGLVSEYQFEDINLEYSESTFPIDGDNAFDLLNKLGI